MPKRKRASLTALVGVLALAGAACGSDNGNDSASTSQESNSSQQTQAADMVTATLKP